MRQSLYEIQVQAYKQLGGDTKEMKCYPLGMKITKKCVDAALAYNLNSLIVYQTKILEILNMLHFAREYKVQDRKSGTILHALAMLGSSGKKTYSETYTGLYVSEQERLKRDFKRGYHTYSYLAISCCLEIGAKFVNDKNTDNDTALEVCMLNFGRLGPKDKHNVPKILRLLLEGGANLIDALQKYKVSSNICSFVNNKQFGDNALMEIMCGLLLRYSRMQLREMGSDAEPQQVQNNLSILHNNTLLRDAHNQRRERLIQDDNLSLLQKSVTEIMKLRGVEILEEENIFRYLASLTISLGKKKMQCGLLNYVLILDHLFSNPKVVNIAAMLLISNGANLETRDIKGRTPLILSALNGDQEVASKLLESGANLNAKDQYDLNAADYAKAKANYEILQLTRNDEALVQLENGIKLNQQENSGLLNLGNMNQNIVRIESVESAFPSETNTTSNSISKKAQKALEQRIDFDAKNLKTQCCCCLF